MITTPKMSLTAWNLPSDAYSSDELAENWIKVDQHDHTGPPNGALITTAALADQAVTAAKIHPDAIADMSVADASITSAKLANNAVTAAKIQNAEVTDAKLASPMGPAYNVLFRSGIVIASGATTNTYVEYGFGNTPITAGGLVSLSQGRPFYYDADDYTVAGKNTRLRIRAQAIIAGTAPAADLTVALQRVAIAAGAFVPTSVATVVIPSASLTTNTIASGVGSDFALSTDGLYFLTFHNSTTTSGVIQAHAQLQLHYT